MRARKAKKFKCLMMIGNSISTYFAVIAYDTILQTHDSLSWQVDATKFPNVGTAYQFLPCFLYLFYFFLLLKTNLGFVWLSNDY